MKWICFLAVSLLFLVSCKNKDSPDVSQIPADVSVYRTEEDLRKVKDTDGFQQLTTKHPAFFKLYLQQILPLYKGENQDSLYLSFRAYMSDTLVSDLFDKVDKKYRNLDGLKKDLNTLYQHLLYYFPDRISVPDFYTFISEYAYQIFIFENEKGKDGIGIGLDMFMHPEIDYKLIDPDNTNFSDYITRSWNADHIVRKVAELHVNDLLGEAPGHRMIDQMIHNGKTLYLLEKMMPEAHDSIIAEYTFDQVTWCYDNELQMWSFFLDQKLFYESNPAKIAKYIFPSPKSPDMPDAAPGRTANFIGWQIVRAYMKRYPETTLSQLIGLTDSQAFLEKSRYKPKQK